MFTNIQLFALPNNPTPAEMVKTVKEIETTYIKGEDVIPTTDPTVLDNYYTKAQSDDRYVNVNGYGYLSDMNTVVIQNKTFYYTNATTNQPNGETWWGTVQYVFGGDNNCVYQIVYKHDSQYFYKRLYYADGRGWQEWQKFVSNSADVEQLLSAEISADTDIELNGSITNYRYIIIGGCDQANGGKSHIMLPSKLFTSNVDSAIKDGWNRLVVSTSDGWVSLWYVRERSNGHSLLHINGFSTTPSFNWLLVYGVK